MWRETLPAKKVIEFLHRGEYQCPYCNGCPRVWPETLVLKVNQTHFSGCESKCFTFLKRFKNQLQTLLAMSFVLTGRVHNKSAFVHTWRGTNQHCYERMHCERCSHLVNLPFEDQKPTIKLFDDDATFSLPKERVVTTEKNLAIHYEKLPLITCSHS